MLILKNLEPGAIPLLEALDLGRESRPMPALQDAFRVAIFDELIDSFSKSPKAQQKKVNKFIRKFRQDPTTPSINHESMSSFADSNLRTVRRETPTSCSGWTTTTMPRRGAKTS